MGTDAQELPKTYGLKLIEQGLEQGLEQGREEGRREALVHTARNLLALGRPPSEVAEATGLPLEEVQKLAH